MTAGFHDIQSSSERLDNPRTWNPSTTPKQGTFDAPTSGSRWSWSW